MATEVYTVEEVRLLDGSEVELRPLSIANMRKFSHIWSDHIKNVQSRLAEAADEESEVEILSEAEMTDLQFDAFIKMCALGLASQLKGDKTDKKFIEYLEEVLDEQTVYRVLFKTGGLSVGEAPNQNPATTPEDGTN